VACATALTQFLTGKFLRSYPLLLCEHLNHLFARSLRCRIPSNAHTYRLLIVKEPCCHPSPAGCCAKRCVRLQLVPSRSALVSEVFRCVFRDGSRTIANRFCQCKLFCAAMLFYLSCGRLPLQAK
jgi:hypothetical protein